MHLRYIVLSSYALYRADGQIVKEQRVESWNQGDAVREAYTGRPDFTRQQGTDGQHVAGSPLPRGPVVLFESTSPKRLVYMFTKFIGRQFKI